MHSSAPYPWQQQQWQSLWQRYSAAQLPHAVLLAGPRGLGKFAFAQALAQGFLCRAPLDSSACGHCQPCRLVESAHHPDLHVLKPQDNSLIIKIDQVRQLVANLVQTSQQGGYQIAVLNRAEQLNGAAANALLKTLEEPAPNSFLLLICEQLSHVLPTIRSRCQVVTFTTVPNAMMQTWLQQQLPDVDYTELALFADGAPLLALHLAADEQKTHRQQWLANFKALLTAEIDPLQLAAQGKEAHPAQIVFYWQMLVVAALRRQHLWQDVVFQQDTINVIIMLLAEKFTPMRLLDYWQQLVVARQQLQTRTCNVQLLLERLCISATITTS